jgi:ABC-type Fe3+/spermidine/putrescine transport system ATPase subunit
MTDVQKPLLEIHGMSKRFGATQALSAVSLTLYPGEVHALLGENGAGKSTLIKIMTGIYQSDSGEMVLDDQSIRIHNSAEAQKAGIAAIYQEPLVFPDLSVAENIFISHRGRGTIVNWPKMYQDAERILAQLGVQLDVHRQARGLVDSCPDLDLIMAPTTVGIAAASKAMQDEGLCDDIAVSGLGLPIEMQEFIENGCAAEFALWRFDDLGYLAYYLTYLLATDQMEAEAGVMFEAGHLGVLTVEEDPTREGGLRVLMGPWSVFSAENYDEWAIND